MVSGILIYVLIGFACFVLLVGIVKSAKKDRNDYREQMDNNEETFYPSSFPTVEEKATVVDRYCYVDTVGIKHPKTMRRFVVAFETENGRRMELPVPEEMYEGFDIGQHGLLSTVEGELFGFALD